MVRKKKCIAGMCILLLIALGKMDRVQADEDVPETITEDHGGEATEEFERRTDAKFCSDIWDDAGYIAVNTGNCYPGSRVEYDVKRNRTILYPAGWQKQLVIREKEKAVIYYGKYRGEVEYEEYETVSPILDVEFFLNPLRALKLTTADIENGQGTKTITIEEEQQLELFYAPLVYEGILNEEEVSLKAVTVSFNEDYMPKEVRFTLSSDVLDMVQLVTLENELTQRYSYMELKEFGEHIDLVKEAMKEIVPEEEITIADYVTDLNNILQAKDEYFLQRLTHQGEELTYFSGWDKRAVLAYLEAVNTKLNAFAGNGYEAENVTKEEFLQELENTYQSARQIGSDVYTYMFEASKIEPKKKALLVLRQMGAYMDENGMLQLGAGDKFAADMTPHSAFLEDYAACVREAYQKNGHKYRTLDDQMIHQFRMYIDKHNIEYVRNYFKGPTDYAKLQAYAKNFEMKLYYGEPSRHHNKIGRGEHFRKQKYDKVLTPNRLSEFIINVETGTFVTQWDVLEIRKDGTVASGPDGYLKRESEKQCVIVDTESFNYAPADYIDAHNALDVLPATPTSGIKKTPYLENDVKSALKEVWESPGKLSYRETYKSSKDYLK